MALSQQQKSAAILGVARDYPDPPELPAELSRTNLDDYRRSMAAFWLQTKANLRALEDRVAELERRSG